MGKRTMLQFDDETFLPISPRSHGHARGSGTSWLGSAADEALLPGLLIDAPVAVTGPVDRST
jgi:hypothetical protein